MNFDEKLQFILIVNEIAHEFVKLYKKFRTISNASTIISEIAHKHKVGTRPTLADVLVAIPTKYQNSIASLLKLKPTRTASGVAVVAVMCKPHRCPHIEETGHACIYCPGGPDSDFEYSSQSYTGYEPTSMRAIRVRYNAFEQVRVRVDQLRRLGHSTDKVEFVIMGGTFMALTKRYRERFVSRMLDALSGHTSTSIEEAVEFSEHGQTKVVALTIETRPDYCEPEHIDCMLRYGCTRLEIGMQTVFDDVIKYVGRGHSLQDIIDCFYNSKAAGYKIVAHMMPNLPETSWIRDLMGFHQLFENPDMRPDGMKIYATLVIRGTKLYDLWKEKRFMCYEKEDLLALLALILCVCAPWCRIYRVQRDIPLPLVTGGSELGSQREMATELALNEGRRITDIRQRECGRNTITDRPELIRRDYVGQGEWETFLSYEAPESDVLIGMLRLRRLKEPVPGRPELQGGVSMIRELHVYGHAVSVRDRSVTAHQHHGYGRLLIKESERIAREEHMSEKLVVIAGIGTKKYYAKFGFVHDGPYMSKML
ncbi:hypothetical protein PCE1_002220 [Barthelona sp. PCE]